MFSAAIKTDNVSSAANYIEECFSTYLYTGTGAAQTITNGIDLSTKGGLVWVKSRSAGYLSHVLADTVRGNTKVIYSDLTAPQDTFSTGISSFNSNGFSIGSSDYYNESAGRFVSWTFREQAKFFDVVTYTGNSTSRTIAHNLGSAPGCIIVKATSASGYQWAVYHRSLTAGNIVWLNLTDASTASSNTFTTTAPTATEFSLGSASGVNDNGVTYVAYLFAHNAGGFGLTGTDNVISCGSVSATGSTLAEVNLGWEPQWVLIKGSNITNGWSIIDNMRGFTADKGVSWLQPNTSAAEVSSPTTPSVYLTATGFKVNSNESPLNGTGTYVYVAIRRGPMKVPTSGTSVFNLASATEPDTTPLFSPGTPPPDSVWYKPRLPQVQEFYLADRLRGNNVILASNATDAERSATANIVPPWKFNSGQKAQLDAGVYFNNSGGAGVSYALYALIRAPGFFDEVCYTGTGVAGLTITHNLGVVPELIILKGRDYVTDWAAYSATLGNTKYLIPNTTAASGTSSLWWNNTSPTATTFTLGNSSRVNNTASNTYVAYLFATCAGVSKVGSYTGTGALQTVNCGFASGARFVLIKRTDSTGDWYVWDSARGISSGNDPYLLINSTAAEVTGTNYVDTTAVGFQVTAAAPAALNASGGTYIFLAVA
jgi:hypothetical protein